ncbi:hypothetical protein [Pseudomonas sp. COW5]|uniref:hypothetical protein n=1 Tax=Pseudomonas sp. COW5 TaxID=2981253 RepID=UPI002245DA58|nr:hypothetical protein [Pseudomonas sp. COW5]MCX2544699.1 hypothetical protein [Pseudomonas sp. COW5]
MVNPGIHAERNLVINGEFTEGLKGWSKGPVNPSYVTTKPESYNGLPLRILSALDGSSAFQEIAVPKSSGADATYRISFLCEMDHVEEGILELSVTGLPETQKIRLKPGAARDRNADRVYEAKGEPLVFLPIEYDEAVTLPLHDSDELRVSVISPGNEQGDFFSSLRISRINLQLHLPATRLQTLRLDDQMLPLDRVLPLCLGALGSSAHRFTCVPAQDDPWQGTRASLNIEANPQNAIVADPDWGKDKPLDDYSSLLCPDIDGEPPHLFKLQLLNEFNAPPYDIAVSLGHHRLKFLELERAKHYVVLEYGQSAKVGVRVGSHYTDRALEGRLVTWTVEGTNVKSTTPTDPDGWAWFDHKPLAAGDLQILASIESPYYASGVVTQAFEAKVLATDPLKEVRTLVAEEERPWEQKGYPNRGTIYKLQIIFPDVLHNTQATLRWTGTTPEQLGVRVTPPLESAVAVGPSGMVEYQLDNDDRLDGQFSLRLISSHLLEHSPEKRMSLARNVVKPGDVREPDRVCVVDENESARMWVQVLHDTALGDGDPVERALVFWKDPDGTVTKRFTGAGGWSSHSYQPLAAGEHPVTATIKAHEEAEPSEKNFIVKAIATSLWKQHVEILLDGKTVDLKSLGLICWHGQMHTLRVVPVSGSSWIGTKSISLDWGDEDPNIGLKSANLGTPFPLTADGVNWTLESNTEASISSPFEMRLKADGVADDRELVGRFINPDLTREVSVKFDQVSAALDGQKLYPCLGAEHRFSIWPAALSPLVGLMASLTWSGTPADQLGASVLPPLSESQPLGAEGAFWALGFISSTAAGQFALTLSLPQLAFVATATPMDLGHHAVSFNHLLESPVDPVVDQDPVWTWANVISRFTGKVVAGVPVTWQAAGDPVIANTDDEGNSGFGFVPASAGIHTVRSSLISLYDNYTEEKSTTIQPLTVDPWSQVKMSIDGQPQQTWGNSTGFPRRKGVHSVVAFLPEELEGQVVRLGQTGTAPSVLGNRYEPELGVAQVVANGIARFSLRAGDLKNGSFALRLSAERLARLSQALPMSQGPGSQVLKINTVSQARSELLWGEDFEASIEVVSSISGKPMGDLLVRFSHPDLGVVETVTDFYGRATVRFVPVTPGASQVTATVGDTLNSVSVEMDLDLAEPRQIVELYEPTGSRQPPDVSQAHAKAKVTSALTGLPLADVPVAWEFAGHAMNSVTNAEGIADLTFTYSDEGDGVLSATVQGGIGGWDMAVLAYIGEVPVIESMTSPATTIVSGDLARADVKIVDRRNGQAMDKVRVYWFIGEVPFTSTLTGPDGKTFFEGWVDEPGEFVITARVGFGYERFLEFIVISELADLQLSIYEVPLGGDITVETRVVPAIAGAEVVLRFTGELDQRVTTNAAGLASAVFTANQIPEGQFATVSATVGATGDAGKEAGMTLVRMVWVKDPAAANTMSFFWNSQPISNPGTAWPIKPNTLVGLGMNTASVNRSKEYAVFCNRSDVSISPPPGFFRSFYDAHPLNWSVNVNLPKHTSIIIVFASRDSTVSGRLALYVSEYGDQFA